MNTFHQILKLSMVLLLIMSGTVLYPIDTISIISSSPGEGRFVLASGGRVAGLFNHAGDDPGVIRAMGDLREDIHRVTGTDPGMEAGEMPRREKVLIAGTLGMSPVIEKLASEGKIAIDSLAGKYESYVIKVIQNPFPGVESALVIAGSDRRGTIYGIYEISEQIGVSPLYWWADVPVKQQKEIFVLPGPWYSGQPAVRYRGIFINDEAPALSGWAYETFGGFNHRFYEKVFELILRMKGNFLWPAMWGRAFYDDDPLNAELADLYGIVIGTSHHEPMMRAHDEWRRYGSGEWNYQKNREELREFWREGIRRMGTNESIVTIGMRGDGDEPMTEGTAIGLLETIVKDQRTIIGEVTGRPLPETMQCWALYKEVQDYYDQGMRVPDDVTLLLCDDNWGNIRRLPAMDETPRKGGYGIYYHFDYVGGPRNYKWINTNQVERVWEQMHMAYQYGVDRIWIVNVGDIKPMEFPVQFFLDYAWNPDHWPAGRLPEYYRLWAAQQFGPGEAASIARIMAEYTKYNARRKPELLSPDTYSLVHYDEADRVVRDYNRLVDSAERIMDRLEPGYHDAFYQLVLFPVKASANLNELTVTVGKNHLYASQKRCLTNSLAQRAYELYRTDSLLTDYFHHTLSGGKWNHMMSQTHIGYTSWQQPDRNIMPEVRRLELPDTALMGIALEGSESFWTAEEPALLFKEFYCSGEQEFYFDIYNSGRVPFHFSIKSSKNCFDFSALEGEVSEEQRIRVKINRKKALYGTYLVPVTIAGPGNSKAEIYILVCNYASNDSTGREGFTERNGYISMEAENYHRAVPDGSVSWLTIPNLGRTSSGVTTMPVTRALTEPDSVRAHLEYKIELHSPGLLKVHAYLSPTLDFHDTGGLRYGISFDDGPVKVVNMHEGVNLRMWERWVADNINVRVTKHTVDRPGVHTLNFWAVDPGVVLQKMVIETKPVGKSYLGPPESTRLNSYKHTNKSGAL